MRKILGLIFCLAPCSAGAQGSGHLASIALECSTSALRTYTLGTCEAASSVIEAAIAKCQFDWNAAIEEQALEYEDKPETKALHDKAVKMGNEHVTGNVEYDKFNRLMKTQRVFRDAMERSFRAQSLAAIFDLRSSAKNCISR